MCVFSRKKGCRFILCCHCCHLRRQRSKGDARKDCCCCWRRRQQQQQQQQPKLQQQQHQTTPQPQSHNMRKYRKSSSLHKQQTAKETGERRQLLRCTYTSVLKELETEGYIAVSLNAVILSAILSNSTPDKPAKRARPLLYAS